MIILGIGGILRATPPRALLKDGELVAAVEESKLARRAHVAARRAAGAGDRDLPGAGGRDAPNRWMRSRSCGPFPTPTFI